jgi:hypothetical protein
MSRETPQKVIVPKKKYVPNFLKQRDIGNFMSFCNHGPSILYCSLIQAIIRKMQIFKCLIQAILRKMQIFKCLIQAILRKMQIFKCFMSFCHHGPLIL